MRILLVAATEPEIAPVVAQLRLSSTGSRLKTGRHRGHAVDVLVSGVGMVATSARCSQLLASESYDLALNFGLCGSFDATLPNGTVVHVVTDRIADLGAEDGDTFLSAHDLGLLEPNEFPFTDGRLVNAAPPLSAVLRELPAVQGITVNTAHGNEASIAAVTARVAPQVESMEGAAFMYACLLGAVPFAQVRAVSNVVERRNRSRWNIAGAVEGLERVAMRMLGEIA